MKSFLDYPELEGKLDWDCEKYTYSHSNWQKAWTLLSAVENMIELRRFVDRVAGDIADDGKKLQHVLFRQGIHALKSIYILTKHHEYNSARGRSRYVYETYLSLKYLNDDQERASEYWEKIRDEAQEIDKKEYDSFTIPEEQTDVLHEIRDDARDVVEHNHPDSESYKTLWRMFSDRGSHPASIQGSYTDGKYSDTSENSLLQIGLAFAFGLVAQYLHTFKNTDLYWPLYKKADQIIVEIKLAIYPDNIPTLFADELRYWNPIFM